MSIDGTSNNDVLIGTAASDIINAYAGNDTITGGGGNDTINGESGNNTYFYYMGDGADLIKSYSDSTPYLGNSTGKFNTISFGEGIYPSGIDAYRSGDNLVLSIIGTMDSITVENFFDGDNHLNNYNPIQQVTFFNGTVWNLETLDDMAFTGNGSSEAFYGTIDKDTFNGLAGNDTYYGRGGNDTYLFGKGDGADVIKSYYDARDYLGNDAGKFNTIQFKSDVAPSDIDAYRSGDNLVLSITGTTDSITIENYFNNNNHLDGYNPIQQVVFYDGTVWNLEAIDDKAFTGNGSSEVFYGTIASDTFNGMGGNDSYNTQGGNDTYLFGKGDGADIIKSFYDTRDYLGNDSGKFSTLMFKVGVLPSEIDAYRSEDDLVLKIMGTTDSIIVENFYNDNNHLNAYNPVQQIKFADGTVWNLETIDDKAFTGNATSEVFYGTIASDTFNGMAGNDSYYGQGSNDIYLFGKGDGADVIKSYYDARDYLGNDLGKFNTIAFKSGVLPSEIDAYRSGDNLVLSIIGTTDSITVENFFDSNNHLNVNNPIQQVTFSDGTVWNLETLDDKAFTGNATSEVFKGTLVNDTFNGLGGSDTFTSNGGNDTYLFGKGDGNDIIQSYYDSRDYLGNDAGKYNVLSLKSGVLPSEVSISRIGTDIKVSILGTDSVLINDFFSYNTVTDYTVNNTYNPVQSIKFSNGMVWSQQDIINHVILGMTITGAVGDDVLVGTIKNDDFFGLTGNDTYIVNDVGDKVTEASTVSTEIDTVLSSVSYTLSANVENLTLTGAAAINATGNGLANTLIGNSANNILDGGAGIDVMMGGAGNDTYVVDNTGDLIVEQSGAGADLVQSYLTAYTLGTQLENLRIMSTGSANGTGNELNNIIYAGVGNNVVDGGIGIDGVSYAYAGSGVNVNLGLTTAQATGGSGTDTILNIENLYGSAYGDTLRGNTVGNKLYGAAGNDLIYVGAGTASDLIDGGAGTDGLSYAYAAIGVKVDLGLTTAQATGGSGSDTIVNIENLYGSAYADTLKGNASGNQLYGVAGNDTLNGMGGNDTLNGGAGLDTFVFNTALSATGNKDTITDFNVADDTIQLENAIFTKLTALGTLATSYFCANATGIAADSNDFICYNTATGVLSYDADGSGSGASVAFAVLGNSVHPALTAADFVVV